MSRRGTRRRGLPRSGIAAAALAALLAIGLGAPTWDSGALGPKPPRAVGAPPPAAPRPEPKLRAALAEMGGQANLATDLNPLHVPAERDPPARAALRERLRANAAPTRELLSPYLARIGSNGILDLIEERWPSCHDEAHDLGKLIFAELGSVGPSLRACQGRCNSGCMHGVLMGAFSDFCGAGGELRLELLAPAVENVCLADETMTSRYRVGDCAHGVGHALMFLAKYQIPNAIDGCSVFRDERLRYYCATGAYMEYLTRHEARDAASQPLLYPCDRQPYPAACARYKLPRVVQRLAAQGRSAGELVLLCRALDGARRRGCFHGLGNALSGSVARGDLSLSMLCALGDARDRSVCIEGAIERLARYDRPAARRACTPLEGPARQTCDAAVRNELYSLEKDMSLYLEP